MRLLTISLSIAALTACTAVPPRPSSVAQGDYASTQAYITRLVDYEMAKNKVAGLSIALVDDQRIVWAQGFGFADVERKIPASAETLYRVGSISKLLTDTAAMQLVERGLLDLDQPVQKYLPGFAPKSHQPQAPITSRQLMTHHSGLPRDRAKGFQNPEPRPLPELANELSQDYAAYAPDVVFSYSNVGISVLGDVVQTLSGTPFAQHLQQSVLTPLGMTSSSFDPGPSNSARMAKGYRAGQAIPEVPLRDVPAGGLNANVNDMSRFISMVFAGGASGQQQILKPETVGEMLRPQNTAVPLDLNFQIGLGWLLSTLGKSTIEGAGPVAHHAGAIGMFRSQMYLLPQHKLGVVVLANSDSATGVVDHIATEALSLALEAKTGIRQPEHSKTGWSNEPLPAQTLQDFAGDYTTLAGAVKISTDGKALRAEAAGHSFNLRQRSDGLLGLDYALLGLISVDLGTLNDIGFSQRTLAGRKLLVARIGAQEMLVGQRIEPPASLGAWQQRLGDYDITNLDGDAPVVKQIRLTQERGFMFVELTSLDESGLPPRTVLMPLSDSEALLLGPLAGSGETVRSVSINGVAHLAYSGYLAKKK